MIKTFIFINILGVIVACLGAGFIDNILVRVSVVLIGTFLSSINIRY
jgi:hypothetical protein